MIESPRYLGGAMNVGRFIDEKRGHQESKAASYTLMYPSNF